METLTKRATERRALLKLSAALGLAVLAAACGSPSGEFATPHVDTISTAVPTLAPTGNPEVLASPTAIRGDLLSNPDDASIQAVTRTFDTWAADGLGATQPITGREAWGILVTEGGNKQTLYPFVMVPEGVIDPAASAGGVALFTEDSATSFVRLKTTTSENADGTITNVWATKDGELLRLDYRPNGSAQMFLTVLSQQNRRIEITAGAVGGKLAKAVEATRVAPTETPKPTATIEVAKPYVIEAPGCNDPDAIAKLVANFPNIPGVNGRTIEQMIETSIHELHREGANGGDGWNFGVPGQRQRDAEGVGIAGPPVGVLRVNLRGDVIGTPDGSGTQIGGPDDYVACLVVAGKRNKEPKYVGVVVGVEIQGIYYSTFQLSTGVEGQLEATARDHNYRSFDDFVGNFFDKWFNTESNFGIGVITAYNFDLDWPTGWWRKLNSPGLVPASNIIDGMENSFTGQGAAHGVGGWKAIEEAAKYKVGLVSTSGLSLQPKP